MAPIPVYSSSPINAAKPTGATPKTAEPGESDNRGKLQPAATSTAPSTTSVEASPAVGPSYAPAQPGARPFLPQQTPAAQPQALATPTQTTNVSSSARNIPPPPQPGAVPVPSPLPPPPKAGEAMPEATAMPPQMAYQPPHAPLPIQGRSSTATALGPQAPAALLQGHHPSAGFSPQAGGPSAATYYQQDANAAGYGGPQRSTSAAATDGHLDNETSVWDTARKWAATAGESLAAAENEVWKRINKD